MIRVSFFFLVLLSSFSLWIGQANADIRLEVKDPAAAKERDAKAEVATEIVEGLDKPLYSPFIERYVLDELKQMRIDMAEQRVALMQQILDREHSSVDRGVSYATNTINYFFYLIAGATSILVIVGWTSIRDMKERLQSLADEEISKLINEYEQRLEGIQVQLDLKSKHIEENREEIEITREVQSLWLRAGQDSNPAEKIAIYDQILKLRGDNCEALTYKADAVLELGEPQWAANLCIQALAIDSQNGHALYQLGCAYVALKHFDEAVQYLERAIGKNDSYRDEMVCDPALEAISDYGPFKKLLRNEPS